MPKWLAHARPARRRIRCRGCGLRQQRRGQTVRANRFDRVDRGHRRMHVRHHASVSRSTSVASATTGSTTSRKVGLQKAIDEGVICESNTKFLEANSEGTNLDENIAVARRRWLRPRDRRPGSRSRPGINAIAPTTRTRRLRDHRRVRDLRHRVWPGQRRRRDPQRRGPRRSRRSRVPSSSGWPPDSRRPNCDCDTVGFLGGQTGPLIAKFEAGYTAGVAGGEARRRSAGRVHRRHDEGLRQPDRRARRCPTRCTTTARGSSTTRPATRERPVQGRGRASRSSRSASTPTST